MPKETSKKKVEKTDGQTVNKGMDRQINRKNRRCGNLV